MAIPLWGTALVAPIGRSRSPQAVSAHARDDPLAARAASARRCREPVSHAVTAWPLACPGSVMGTTDGFPDQPPRLDQHGRVTRALAYLRFRLPSVSPGTGRWPRRRSAGPGEVSSPGRSAPVGESGRKPLHPRDRQRRRIALRADRRKGERQGVSDPGSMVAVRFRLTFRSGQGAGWPEREERAGEPCMAWRRGVLPMRCCRQARWHCCGSPPALCEAPIPPTD